MRQNTKRADKAPIPIPLEQLAALGEVWARTCNFDHPSVPLVAHAILTTNPDGTVTKRTCSTYSGTMTPKALDRFNQAPGRVLKDAAAERIALIKAGFKLITPTEPEIIPKKRRGGGKGAAK